MKFKCLLLSVLLLCSCSPFLQPDFETPTVSVSAIRILPGSEIVPTFEIGLHVVNPNRTVLKLQGLSYQVELEGHQVLFGATSRLPVIDAYGEGTVTLQARPDLVNTVRLFSDLMSSPRDTFEYAFSAALDVGSFFPKIRVKKSGQMRLKE